MKKMGETGQPLKIMEMCACVCVIKVDDQTINATNLWGKMKGSSLEMWLYMLFSKSNLFAHILIILFSP